MCLLFTILTIPLCICIPCIPCFIILNLFARLLAVVVLLVCSPLVLIPPCTCIYPVIAVLVFIRDGEIPEVSRIPDILSAASNSSVILETIVAGIGGNPSEAGDMFMNAVKSINSMNMTVYTSSP